MRRPLALTASAIAATLIATPALAANRSFSVPDFAKLRVEGPYTVHVRTGSHVSVTAHGPQRRLERLIVEARDGRLVISTEKSAFNIGWAMGEDQEVVVDITVPMISAASLNGSGDVSVDRIRTPMFEAAVTGSGNLAIGEVHADRLSAVVTGSGDLSLAGHADRAEAAVRGSGDIKAGGLAVGALTVNISGSGDVTVGPTRQAGGTLVGSGDVSIAGHPTCAISKHGSGDVRCGG
jgi:hypothetical protein